MKKHLFTIVIGAASMVASHQSRAPNIVATHDAYGHTVWVASDEVKPQTVKPRPSPQTVNPETQAQSQQPEQKETANSAQPASTQEAPSRSSGLVYWSNKEHRWKAVPLASSATMKAARRAAQEVNEMVAAPVSRNESRVLKASQPVDLKSENLTMVRPLDSGAVDKAIDAAAERQGVDPNLVRAVEGGIKLQSAGGFAQGRHGTDAASCPTPRSRSTWRTRLIPARTLTPGCATLRACWKTVIGTWNSRWRPTTPAAER